MRFICSLLFDIERSDGTHMTKS